MFIACLFARVSVLGAGHGMRAEEYRARRGGLRIVETRWLLSVSFPELPGDVVVKVFDPLGRGHDRSGVGNRAAFFGNVYRVEQALGSNVTQLVMLKAPEVRRLLTICDESARVGKLPFKIGVPSPINAC